MKRSKYLEAGEHYNFERIVELRKDRGLTQSSIAEMLSMSQRNYSHIEIGDYDISGYEIRILADLFGTNTDYLLGRTDDPRPLPPSKNYKVIVKNN